jgi:ribosomal protein S18 acetylase RimI-like enzyme
MLEYLPGPLLEARPLTFTDINADFLALAESRLGARSLRGEFHEDNLEATRLAGPIENAIVVLVLEHCDWRRALVSLRAWQCQRVLIVIQENPAHIATAVTPGLEVPGTMQVFRDRAQPHLIALDELRAAMSSEGFSLARVETAFVPHSKMMHACYFEAQPAAFTIHSFRPALAPHFEVLQREWLERYFAVEPKDEAMFADPYGKVVAPGGQIFFLEAGGAFAGSVAAIPHGEELELAKLAVTASAQGRGYGRILSGEVIALARRGGYPSAVVYSDSSLVPALRLYESLGFEHFTSDAPTGYTRGDVRMRLRIAASEAATSRIPISS